jgi:hypothetical protein
MKRDLADLKARVPFRALVQETHHLVAGKVLCPHHDDHTPSCHVYEAAAHCFVCGWHADHITWLELVHSLTTAAAIRELERRAGGVPATRRTVRATPPPQPKLKSCAARPVPTDVLAAHMKRVTATTAVPRAAAGRGFTLADLKTLLMAAAGHDLVLAVRGPDGTVVALKRRHAVPQPHRYTYELPGHGTPAWCSPGFTQGAPVLVVEGELNAAACWLARPDLAVTGAAGTGGGLHLAALKGRTVYVYADDDAAGQAARDRWAQEAARAGAAAVYLLEPWPVDACDIAGTHGREALAERLTQSMATARPYSAPEVGQVDVSPAAVRVRTYRAGIYARLRGWR